MPTNLLVGPQEFWWYRAPRQIFMIAETSEFFWPCLVPSEGQPFEPRTLPSFFPGFVARDGVIHSPAVGGAGRECDTVQREKLLFLRGKLNSIRSCVQDAVPRRCQCWHRRRFDQVWTQCTRLPDVVTRQWYISSVKVTSTDSMSKGMSNKEWVRQRSALVSFPGIEPNFSDLLIALVIARIFRGNSIAEVEILLVFFPPSLGQRTGNSVETGLHAVPVTGTAVVLTGVQRVRTVTRRSIVRVSKFSTGRDGQRDGRHGRRDSVALIKLDKLKSGSRKHVPSYFEAGLWLVSWLRNEFLHSLAARNQAGKPNVAIHLEVHLKG
ncbi:hypothetical protein C8R45DRAFT_947162 [Mycena sanguinolenta]|nr:hypothetical protein C8R45DRAFT_947162 [Mycena sanguinolenta]